MNALPRVSRHIRAGIVSAGVIVEPQVRVNRTGHVCPLGAPPINYSPRTKQGGTNAARSCARSYLRPHAVNLSMNYTPVAGIVSFPAERPVRPFIV